MPLLWPIFTLPLHLVGWLAVRLRLRLVEHNDDWQSGNRPAWSRLHSKVSMWASREFRLSSTQQPSTLVSKPETYGFLITNWVLSPFSVLHIILGTLVFSSIIFIRTGDAAVVACRYAASSLCCKLVLAHEVRGLRQIIDIGTVPFEAAPSQLELEAFKHRETFSSSEIRPLLRTTE